MVYNIIIYEIDEASSNRQSASDLSEHTCLTNYFLVLNHIQIKIIQYNIL